MLPGFAMRCFHACKMAIFGEVPKEEGEYFHYFLVSSGLLNLSQSKMKAEQFHAKVQ